MHHSDSTGDSPGTRKMAHASVFTSRRGSNTGSSTTGVTSASSTSASMNCNAAITTDDHLTPLIVHHQPPTGSSSSSSSSPGPHQQPPPPHSLNIHLQAQTQTLQSAGAQVKKKSGFQITSVLPAQVSASTNNSIADDTESYDDMDESHTEDLSSSDILDVSVSRATDPGIPERSSSEETLNSLHGGETPGVVSPNEPVMHHSHSQSSQQGYMVNGTVHHHGHGLHHHSHQPHGHQKEQGSQSQPVAAPQPVQGLSGSSATGASVAPAKSTAAQSGAAVQGRPQGRVPSVRAAVVEASATGSGIATVNQHVSSVSAGSVSGAAGIPGGGSLPASTTGAVMGNVMTAHATQPPPPTNTTPNTATAAASTATGSRFRVVKLDSSSEPFRKGRWTCTEFYEKEAPVAAPSTDAPPTHRAVESVVQSETESTSGGSSSSTMSGGGDQGPQPVQQVLAPAAMPVPSQGIPQLHTLPQDPGTHAVVPPAVAPSNNPQVVSVPGLLGTTDGQPPLARPQQQVAYNLEGQVSQMQSGYTINQQAALPVNQGLQPIDYAQISQGIQATAQPQQVSVPTQIPGLPIGTPVAGSAISPRPQAPVPSMVLAQGSTISQAQTLPPHQVPSEQQHQAAVGQQPQPSSSTTGQTAPSIPSSTLQSNLQQGLPHSLQHGHPGGLGLSFLPSAGGHYGGMAPLTASQLEDAGRLLFQHQSLLSLPRLATGGVAGLIAQTASEAGVTLGQEGLASGDAGALAASAGTEEDSSSGASVVAIDNKIEQAMDLVKSHLMYAVREEVEVLKEQIKELIERNTQLEQENNLLKNLASPEQLAQFQAQVQTSSPTSGAQPASLVAPTGPPPQSLPPSQGMGPPV
ncbi:TSC22 domain family protein 1-like isoform X1 [Astyanax mexicanus]|uniref:TSC22 domain family protein 1 n=1 Tax=Astyanax mexicanus TaxID=7994 RepID=A0A8T2M492_ASTMX|nr:TSC22 domain family protein 1-like isoform X1 [Astyanax mexicanus]